MTANSSPQRWGRLLVLAWIVVLALGFVQPMSTPDKAEAVLGIPGPCDLIPNDTMRTICEVGTNPGTAVPAIGIGAIPGVPDPVGIVTGAVEGVAKTFIDEIVSLEVQAVSWLLGSVIDFVYSSSTPTFTAQWFLVEYALVFGVGVIIALYVWVYNMWQSVRRNDASHMVRSSIQISGYFVLCIWLPALVSIAVTIADGVIVPTIVSMLGESPETSLKHLQEQFVEATSPTGLSALPVLIPGLILVLGVVGGILTWLMLAYRFVAILLMVPGAALMYSLSGAGAWGKDQSRRTTQHLVALILFKAILVAVMTFSLLAASSDPDSKSLTPMLLTSTMLILTPIIGWMIYRSFSGDRVPVTQVISSTVRHSKSAAALGAA